MPVYKIVMGVRSVAKLGTPVVSYIVSDDYLVVRINRRNALKTKIRGFSNKVEQMLNELSEDERPIASVVIGLALYRCRNAERYINLLRRSFFDPNLKSLLYAIARYYVNMHSILQNLASKTATLIRYVLTVLH